MSGTQSNWRNTFPGSAVGPQQHERQDGHAQHCGLQQRVRMEPIRATNVLFGWRCWFVRRSFSEVLAPTARAAGRPRSALRLTTPHADGAHPRYLLLKTYLF